MTSKRPAGDQTVEAGAATTQESQFQALIETALDLVAVLNYDGAIRYLSPSARTVIGYTPEELMGENAFAYMHPEDAAEQIESFRIVVSDPSLATAGQAHSFRFRHKDGHWVVLEAVSAKLPEGPEPPGVVVNARDVTKRAQADESMRETAETERLLAQESEVMAEVGRIISSTLNIEEVFELFAAQVKRLIKCDLVLATVVDYIQQTTTIRYSSGPLEFRESVNPTVPLKGSITGAVLASRQPLLVESTSRIAMSDPFIHLASSHRQGVVIWLGIPMVNRGQVIGALLLSSSEPRAFSELDVALAGRVGNQIAGAIDNAGLFGELKIAEADLASNVIERGEAASQNEVIAEIGRIISSTLNIEEVYQPFTDQVGNLISFDVLSVCVLERDGRSGRIIHRAGDQFVGNTAGSLVPMAGSLTGEVARLKQPIIIQGISEQELQERFPFTVVSYQANVRSWLCTPLINGGDFVGSLLMLSSDENAFTERDLNLAQRVGNQIAGAIGSARLYGELKNAEAGLAASNERNQLILETAHDAFVGIDDRGQVIAWNSQAEKTFGWASGEAVRRRLSDLIIPARFADQHQAGIRLFLATGEGPALNRRLEMVAKHRDGREFPVEITIAPLKLGERYLFNAFIRDISERVEADQALRRSEERFRAVYNNAANGMGTRSLDGSIDDLNPAFLRMVGYTLEEIKNLEPGVLFDKRYIELERRLCQRALEGEPIPIYEKEYIHKDGTTVYAEVRASLDLDEDGNPIGFVAVTTDITERKRLEHEIDQHTKSLEVANYELQQLDRLKDEFISTVSHELRTPLTSIKGSAELLLSFNDEDRETQLEFLRIINNESDRLTRLINDVLDLSHMESRQMRWSWDELDLSDVVRAAVDATQALVMQKQLSINVELDSNLPRLWNDQDRLVQVVTNLLSNSIKFTSEGGEVWITAKRLPADQSDGLGEKLLVCVSDTGIGIQTADHGSIFQKFKQVGNTLSDKPRGTGLGLPICKQIVQYFGGKIWVESTIGKGSSFFFTVPVSAEEQILRPDNVPPSPHAIASAE